MNKPEQKIGSANEDLTVQGNQSPHGLTSSDAQDSDSTEQLIAGLLQLFLTPPNTFPNAKNQEGFFLRYQQGMPVEELVTFLVHQCNMKLSDMVIVEDCFPPQEDHNVIYKAWLQKQQQAEAVENTALLTGFHNRLESCKKKLQAELEAMVQSTQKAK